jgi:cation transport ATPase
MARRRRHRQPALNNDSQQQAQMARKDASSALMVWAVLEFLSLLILPTFKLVQGDHLLQTWLSITIPLGVIGAVLIGVSSWAVKQAQNNIDRQTANKDFYVTLAQAIGWLGVIGVGFPLIVVGLELWFSMLRGGK